MGRPLPPLVGQVAAALVADRGQLPDRGIDLYQGLKAPPVFWPMLRSLEASAYGQAGRAADGLAMIDEALEIAGRGARADRDGATSGTQLRAVYDTFAEGFTTADLTEARVLTGNRSATAVRPLRERRSGSGLSAGCTPRR